MTLTRIPTRIPVGNFLPVRPLLALIPPVVVLSAIAAVDEFDPSLFLTWVAIHLVTIAMASIPAIVVKQVLVARGVATISLGSLLVTAIVVGVGKATMTASAEAIIGLSDSWTDNLAVRSVGATFTAVWVLVFTAYARTGLQRLSESREELVRQNVATRLATESSPLGDELGEPLERMRQLRARVASGDDSPRSKEIREVVDTTIRPLSRALWSVENARYPAISLSTLLQLSLQSGKVLSGWIALVWASLSFTALAVPIGVVNSAVYNLITAAIAIGVWTLAIPALSRRISLAVPTISAISLVTVTSGAFLASLLIPGGGQLMTAVAIIAGAAWMALVVTGVSIIQGGIQIADLISRDLASNSTQALIERQTADLFAEENAKKLATQLHGDIQSRLLGIAAAIDHRALSAESVVGELDGVIASLDTLLATRGDGFGVERRQAREQLEGLVASWRGLLDVTIDPQSMKCLVSALEHTPELIDIVREGLTNAHRHGNATEVCIQWVDNHDGATLTVTDNGYGPLGGSPGLGSALLERYARSAWRLSAHNLGGSVLVVNLASTGQPREIKNLR